MVDFISKQLRASKKANYQPVMIKTLLKNEGKARKKEIASELQKANDTSKFTSYYLTVPVYRVLKNQGVVTESGIANPVYSLNLRIYTKEQFDELIMRLDSWIKRSDKFLQSGFLPFGEAREEVRKLAKEHNIKNAKDWDEFIKSGKKPDNIPSNPSQMYKKKK